MLRKIALHVRDREALRLSGEAAGAVHQMLHQPVIDPDVAFVRAEVRRQAGSQCRLFSVAIPCPVPSSRPRPFCLDRQAARMILVCEPEPQMRRLARLTMEMFAALSPGRKSITSRGWSNRSQRWSWFCIHSVFSLASVPALFR